MNNGEITAVLKSCPITEKLFRGAYARDQIPPNCYNNPGYFIYNTAPAHQSGHHWNLVFINDSNLEHFDSLGGSPPSYICKNAPFVSIIYNTHPVQYPFNTTCGQHCIFFAYLKCLGITYKTIMDRCYLDNNEKNDAMVSRFLYHHFGVLNETQDMDFIISQIQSMLSE